MSTERLPPLAVGAVVRDRDRVLLIKRGKDPNRGRWTVPGGKVEWGETMREAVRREVREETGLEVDVADPVWIGELIDPDEPPQWHFVLIDFEAHPTGGEPKPGDDADEVAWFHLDEALELDLTVSMREMLSVLT